MQIRIGLLIAALCACCSIGNAVSPPKTELIDVPSSTKASTTITDQVSDKSSASTGSTNVDPITEVTSTPAPIPSKPTPTSTTTTTTTPTPTPTPAPAPAPTPAPKPAPPGPLPPPEQGTWSFEDVKKNVTCIMVQFAAQLNVTYTKANTTTLAYVVLNVPSNASVVSGSCEGDDQLIALSWPVDNSNFTNTMTLTYHKNDTLKSYGLKSLDFALSPDVFVNSTSTSVVELNHGCEWQSPLGASYRCSAATHMNLSTAAAGPVATLTLSRLQEEAFRTTNGTNFSAARDCGGADLPDAVPIAVGCALGGLVVVVLVAYLVGRRTSAARGYLSM